MLALSRVYLRPSSLVLVDEASMGLAPLVVDRVFEFLQGVAREGKSLLVVEQYVDRALAIADVVYILSRGTVVFSGSPAEVQSSDVFDRYLAIDSELSA